jgi:hypothetical protein
MSYQKMSITPKFVNWYVNEVKNCRKKSDKDGKFYDLGCAAIAAMDEEWFPNDVKEYIIGCTDEDGNVEGRYTVLIGRLYYNKVKGKKG